MGFLDDLKNGILVADGAMGTLLYSYGVGFCFEELNILQPEKIQQVHEAYLKAGAKVIQTNTFGANSHKLQRYGLEKKVHEINVKAVQIARAAAQDKAYVLGTIGSTRGIRKGSASLREIKRNFKEQLDSLLSENIDGILLETFYDLEELTTVLKIARKETSLPIVAQASIYEIDITTDGTPLAIAFNQLEALGADVVGLNCRLGPHHMVLALEKIPLPKKAFLSAYPNASLPDYIDGQMIYESEPAYYADKALELQKLGVRLIGGCCGTTPKHIKAIAAKLHGVAPVAKKIVTSVIKPTMTMVEPKHEAHLHEIVKQRRSIIVELDPPKDLDVTRFFQGAQALNKVGIDALTIADNSLASPRISNVAVGSIVKNQYGLRPLIHITCRDHNLIGLQSHLMGLHTLGITQVLAVTGDPTKVGDLPGASSVYDLSSFELIQLIKQFNQGISFSGKQLDQKTSFSVAAAFNPNVRNFDHGIKRLEKKIAAGADYLITQPVYSEQQIFQLHEATKHLNTPIYIGIMPLISSRNAEFLHNEVPGIRLSEEIRKRMAYCMDDKVASAKEGLSIAKSLIDVAMPLFNGIYLITPFLRYELSIELAEYIQEKDQSALKRDIK
jgi:homocysteine S-methyltransferase